MRRKGMTALATAAVGLGAGLVAQRSVVQRRRRTDPEAGEVFGKRRGHSPRTIELGDGARLAIEEVGPPSRKGAVFIHGSAMRSDMWHYQMEGLADHRLVFYDLRGHGLSQPKGDAPFTMPTLADDLAKVIEAASLDEVVIVGHSIGGMIALELCRSHTDLLGDLVKGIVLLNTTHRPAAETLIGGAGAARVERFIRRPLDMMGSRAEYIERLRKIVKPTDGIFMMVSAAAFGPNASAKQIDFTYDMLADTSADVIFDLLRSYRDFEVTEHLSDINVPALVVGSTHDRLTVLEASRYLAANLPKAELVVLDRCGHMSMLERHRDLNRLLTTFLDDTLGESGSPARRRRSI